MSKIHKEQQNIALAKSTGHQRSSGKADAENKALKLKLKKTDKSSQMPPKRKKTYKSAATRARVLTKHIGGKSNREIAQEEGIDRATVSRILSRDEVVKMVKRNYFDIVAMVPQALDVYKDLLESKDKKMRFGVASRVIDVLRIFSKDDIWSEPAMPEQENDGAKRVLVQIAEMMIDKNRNTGIPLPSMFNEVDTGELRREPPSTLEGERDDES